MSDETYWGPTRKGKADIEKTLEVNDLQNALLLNGKQTDESYQIFMPFSNINISSVSG